VGRPATIAAADVVPGHGRPRVGLQLNEEETGGAPEVNSPAGGLKEVAGPQKEAAGTDNGARTGSVSCAGLEGRPKQEKGDQGLQSGKKKKAFSCRSASRSCPPIWNSAASGWEFPEKGRRSHEGR